MRWNLILTFLFLNISFYSCNDGCEDRVINLPPASPEIRSFFQYEEGDTILFRSSMNNTSYNLFVDSIVNIPYSNSYQIIDNICGDENATITSGIIERLHLILLSTSTDSFNIRININLTRAEDQRDHVGIYFRQEFKKVRLGHVFAYCVDFHGAYISQSYIDAHENMVSLGFPFESEYQYNDVVYKNVSILDFEEHSCFQTVDEEAFDYNSDKKLSKIYFSKEHSFFQFILESGEILTRE